MNQYLAQWTYSDNEFSVLESLIFESELPISAASKLIAKSILISDDVSDLQITQINTIPHICLD